MLNNVTVMGRLTRDPELRRTQSGTAVASFSLACDRDYKSGDERGCDFIDFVAWGAKGEFVQKWFHKGDLAVAVGRLQIRDWTDNEGAKRRSTEVVVSNIYFGSSKKSSDAPVPPADDFEHLSDDVDVPW